MDTSPRSEHWVVCPVCHKANFRGKRYCERCFGAVVHPEVEITEEEEQEVKRLRQAYLKRNRIKKYGTIGLGSLVIIIAVYFGLYYLTDTVYNPPADLNSDSGPGEWTMFGYDLGHSGATGININPQGSLKWTFSTDAPIHSSPAVVDGTVYFGSQDHSLYSLDAETGVKNWEFVTGSWVESSPAIADGRLFFGSNDSRLYALDSESGEKLWDFKTSFPVESSPSITDDTVYFGSDDYFIYALDVETGEKRWDFNTGSPVKSSPIVTDGILYTGSGGGGYSFALNAENGLRRLRFKSHYSVYAAPAAKDKTIYFVASNGLIYAIESRARTWLREHEIKPLWTQMWLMGIPGIPQPPPQSGLLWTFSLPGPSFAVAPLIADDVMYIASEKLMIAIDLQTQEQIWEFEGGGTIRSSPAIVGDSIYFGSEDGKVYALDSSSGEKQWDFATGDKITSSPAVVDGVIYITSHDGKLYAIE